MEVLQVKLLFVVVAFVFVVERIDRMRTLVESVNFLECQTFVVVLSVVVEPSDVIFLHGHVVVVVRQVWVCGP